ncbi:heavy-metal-associated domain-containing protein [Microbacterium sp. P06]|uniref:heavy-metal-associated domain-containing protein n=1 Tax=unclassified Microbacterium TaxID=2609290 RepID=UPI0037453EB7
MTIQPLRLTPIGDEVSLEPAEMCGCSGGSCSVASAPASEALDQRDVLVDGMTCEHCVRAVTEELGALAGVDEVSVDLVVGGSSRVRIRTSQPLDDDAVRDAVEEAGYQLA